MTYEDFLAQNVTKIVTKRVKLTERQADKLAEIEEELGIPPSAVIRLALNCFLPKLRDEQFRYGGIKINFKYEKETLPHGKMVLGSIRRMAYSAS